MFLLLKMLVGQVRWRSRGVCTDHTHKVFHVCEGQSSTRGSGLWLLSFLLSIAVTDMRGRRLFPMNILIKLRTISRMTFNVALISLRLVLFLLRHHPCFQLCKATASFIEEVLDRFTLRLQGHVWVNITVVVIVVMLVRLLRRSVVMRHWLRVWRLLYLHERRLLLAHVCRIVLRVN